MNKIRVGILGVGGMGKVHCAGYMNNENCKVVAACGRNEKALKDFAKGEWGKVEYGEVLGEFVPKYKIEKIYTDYKKMAEDKEIDAVSICTPNSLHAPISILFLKSGKNVLVEKPMAANEKECVEMIKTAKKKSVKLAVGHMWRFHREVKFVKDAVDKGLIGKVVKTKGYGIHVRWGPSGWFAKKKLAIGGSLIDMGIHAIDTVRYIMDEPEPKRVYAKVNTLFGDYDVDDLAVVFVEWENGAVSIIESGWWNPHSDGTEASTQLFGTKGYARVFPTEVIYKIGNEYGKFVPEPKNLDENVAVYQKEIDHFIESILKDKDLLISAEVGMNAVRIAEAAYKSSKSGKVVNL